MTEREYDLRIYRIGLSDEYLPSVTELKSSMVERLGLRLIKKYEGLSPIKVAAVFVTVNSHRGTPKKLNSKIEEILSGEEK